MHMLKKQKQVHSAKKEHSCEFVSRFQYGY